MARPKVAGPKQTEKKADIFSQKALEDLALSAQEELPVALEELITFQADTRILKNKPAHYYRYLYFLAKAMRATLCVELGTWHGLSTACLADGVGVDGIVVTIDRDSVVKPTAIRRNVEYWIQNGTMILKHDVNDIDILFIDAGHDGACLEEYKFWMPRMKNKSVVLFDDINLNDAMKAFWKNFNPIAGRKFDLPIHGEAGFGAVLINN